MITVKMRKMTEKPDSVKVIQQANQRTISYSVLFQYTLFIRNVDLLQVKSIRNVAQAKIHSVPKVSSICFHFFRVHELSMWSPKLLFLDV